jgi:hypothetical protein
MTARVDDEAVVTVDKQSTLPNSLSTLPSVPENRSRAAHHFKLSADQGFVDAQRKYGHLLMSGDGVRQNEALGAQWLKLAADHGLRSTFPIAKHFDFTRRRGRRIKDAKRTSGTCGPTPRGGASTLASSRALPPTCVTFARIFASIGIVLLNGSFERFGIAEGFDLFVGTPFASLNEEELVLKMTALTH